MNIQTPNVPKELEGKYKIISRIKYRDDNVITLARGGCVHLFTIPANELTIKSNHNLLEIKIVGNVAHAETRVCDDWDEIDSIQEYTE